MEKSRENKKYQCNFCNEEFQDGDIVAMTDKGYFHHSVRLNSRIYACSSKKEGLSWNLTMYYNGKINHLPRLREFLFAKRTVHVENNGNKKGEMFTGDLEGLLEPIQKNS